MKLQPHVVAVHSHGKAVNSWSLWQRSCDGGPLEQNCDGTFQQRIKEGF